LPGFSLFFQSGEAHRSRLIFGTFDQGKVQIKHYFYPMNQINKSILCKVDLEKANGLKLPHFLEILDRGTGCILDGRDAPGNDIK
jgi:hypothetical protein